MIRHLLLLTGFVFLAGCGAASDSTSPQPLNLNTATAAELSTLPLIGPGTAQRIIDYRQEYGPFSEIEQLLAIRGIDKNTINALRPLVTCTSAHNSATATAIGRVNINTAAIEDLAPLPAVGRTTAARIIAYRIDNGPYTSVDELEDVPGIPPQELSRFREYLCVR